MSKTHRLFELINALRARRQPVTAASLAHELGVTPRTVYRDIETLRSLGAPVDGQSGVGYLLREGFFLPQLAFSREEMDALRLGLDWVRQRADSSLAQGSESALSKIVSTTAQGSAPTGEWPTLVPAASSSAPADSPQGALLRDAIRRQRKVEISYEDAQGGGSHRTLWPIAIVYFEDVRVLAAWCELRAAFRHFRMDRVQVRAVSEERYPGRRQSLLMQWRAHDTWAGPRS